jgi:hypothetical protein
MMFGDSNQATKGHAQETACHPSAETLQQFISTGSCRHRNETMEHAISGCYAKFNANNSKQVGIAVML